MEMMEIKLTNMTNPLMSTSEQKRLQSKYERLKKSRVTKKKKNEETGLTAIALLG